MEKYQVLDVIGRGSYGTIHRLVRRADGHRLILKRIPYHNLSAHERQQIVSEVNILRTLRHDNIVRYYERFVDRERRVIGLVMEYCGGGDLAEVVRAVKAKGGGGGNRGLGIEEGLVWRWFAQLAMALNECHYGYARRNGANAAKGEAAGEAILHRDLKCANVFLDENKNVKLGDFGLSRVVTHPDHGFARTLVGTPYYMSPELVSGATYNVKSDIWGLGCLIYELCLLEPPFLARSQAELNARIAYGVPMRSVPDVYSDELRRAISSMLNVNPSLRPSTIELLQVPRIQDIALQIERSKQAANKDSVFLSENAGTKRPAQDSRLLELESALLEREKAIAAKERILAAAEESLNMRARELDMREASLWPREETIARKEVEVAGMLKQVQAKVSQAAMLGGAIVPPSHPTSVISATGSRKPKEGRGALRASPYLNRRQQQQLLQRKEAGSGGIGAIGVVSRKVSSLALQRTLRLSNVLDAEVADDEEAEHAMMVDTTMADVTRVSSLRDRGLADMNGQAAEVAGNGLADVSLPSPFLKLRR